MLTLLGVDEEAEVVGRALVPRAGLDPFRRTLVVLQLDVAERNLAIDPGKGGRASACTPRATESDAEGLTLETCSASRQGRGGDRDRLQIHDKERVSTRIMIVPLGEDSTGLTALCRLREARGSARVCRIPHLPEHGLVRSARCRVGFVRWVSLDR